MASKFFRAFNTIARKLPGNKSKVAPTITQPRQLKTTMKRIQSENKKFGFIDAKTAKDRANIVRRKKSIERMEKLDKAKAKRKEGIKASKDIKRMIGTGQADKVGGSVYHRMIKEKKAEGGVINKAKQFLGMKTKGPKSQAEYKKITSSDAYKKADIKTKNKMLGSKFFTGKEMEEKIKKKKQGIKEKIKPKKKMDRLEELRKELGMKKGGKAKKKFPDLTGDGKVTQADILKGRGVFRKGGASK